MASSPIKPSNADCPPAGHAHAHAHTHNDKEDEVDEVVERVGIHDVVHDIHPALQSDDLRKQAAEHGPTFSTLVWVPFSGLTTPHPQVSLGYPSLYLEDGDPSIADIVEVDGAIVRVEFP